jgi:hypothetical protein
MNGNGNIRNLRSFPGRKKLEQSQKDFIFNPIKECEKWGKDGYKGIKSKIDHQR